MPARSVPVNSARRANDASIWTLLDTARCVPGHVPAPLDTGAQTTAGEHAARGSTAGSFRNVTGRDSQQRDCEMRARSGCASRDWQLTQLDHSAATTGAAAGAMTAAISDRLRPCCQRCPGVLDPGAGRMTAGQPHARLTRDWPRVRSAGSRIFACLTPLNGACAVDGRPSFAADAVLQSLSHPPAARAARRPSGGVVY